MNVSTLTVDLRQSLGISNEAQCSITVENEDREQSNMDIDAEIKKKDTSDDVSNSFKLLRIIVR